MAEDALVDALEWPKGRTTTLEQLLHPHGHDHRCCACGIERAKVSCALCFAPHGERPSFFSRAQVVLACEDESEEQLPLSRDEATLSLLGREHRTAPWREATCRAAHGAATCTRRTTPAAFARRHPRLVWWEAA